MSVAWPAQATDRFILEALWSSAASQLFLQQPTVRRSLLLVHPQHHHSVLLHPGGSTESGGRGRYFHAQRDDLGVHTRHSPRPTRLALYTAHWGGECSTRPPALPLSQESARSYVLRLSSLTLWMIVAKWGLALSWSSNVHPDVRRQFSKSIILGESFKNQFYPILEFKRTKSWNYESLIFLDGSNQILWDDWWSVWSRSIMDIFHPSLKALSHLRTLLSVMIFIDCILFVDKMTWSVCRLQKLLRWFVTSSAEMLVFTTRQWGSR